MLVLRKGVPIPVFFFWERMKRSRPISWSALFFITNRCFALNPQNGFVTFYEILLIETRTYHWRLYSVSDVDKVDHNFSCYQLDIKQCKTNVLIIKDTYNMYHPCETSNIRIINMIKIFNYISWFGTRLIGSRAKTYPQYRFESQNFNQ